MEPTTTVFKIVSRTEISQFKASSNIYVMLKLWKQALDFFLALEEVESKENYDNDFEILVNIEISYFI